MSRTAPPRRRVGVLLPLSLALGVVIAAFGDRLVTHFSYAAERGKIQANQEELAAGSAAAGVQEVSNAFRMVARVVRPGVVQIQVSGGEVDPDALDAIREQLKERFGREFSEEDWQRYLRERANRPIATGSGILLDGEGNILTNNHVVAGSACVSTTTANTPRGWWEPTRRPIWRCSRSTPATCTR
jgi:S1-C subfamily serine protease